MVIIHMRTITLVCPCFHSHLRADTVAQILTHANIRAHSAVLVMETCQSLLVGALLERMGGGVGRGGRGGEGRGGGERAFSM